MKFVIWSKTNKNKTIEIFPPLLLAPPYEYICVIAYMHCMCMCMCNAERQKRSEKGSNFKEDDSSLPLEKLLLYAVTKKGSNFRNQQSSQHFPPWRRVGFRQTIIFRWQCSVSADGLVVWDIRETIHFLFDNVRFGKIFGEHGHEATLFLQNMGRFSIFKVEQNNHRKQVIFSNDNFLFCFLNDVWRPTSLLQFLVVFYASCFSNQILSYESKVFRSGSTIILCRILYTKINVIFL